MEKKLLIMYLAQEIRRKIPGYQALSWRLERTLTCLVLSTGSIWNFMEENMGIIRRTPIMNFLPIKCVFRLKYFGRSRTVVLHKARCFLRGDHQEIGIDFDPLKTYDPVASHEAVRILLVYDAYHGLIFEAGDVSNAYLYGDINCTLIIVHTTNSPGNEEIPGLVCKPL